MGRQLVNESTVVSLTREMLNYLVVAMPEHKAQLCDKITAAAERCVSLVVFWSLFRDCLGIIPVRLIVGP